VIVLSLGLRDAHSVASLLADPPAGAGAVEVRLDLLPRPDGAAIGRASDWRRKGIPRIATCRRRREGGGYQGGEAGRASILGSALDAGFQFADVESGSGCAGRILADYPGRVILSHHDRRGTPPVPEMLRRYRESAGRRGVAVVKLVTTARDAADILRLRLLLKLARIDGVPLIAFAMGECGRASRILAPSWGSWATYASANGRSRTAPGQLTLDEAAELYQVDAIHEGTVLTAIAGDPVAHSLSPLIHNLAYRRLGLDWRYLPLHVREPATLPDLIRGLPLAGVSVTAPHKVSVMSFPGLTDPAAEQIGAANTLVMRRGRIRRWNTDVDGVIGPLKRLIRLRGCSALVLGAGGAARAAAFALSEAGARVIVASRRPVAGRAVARLAGGRWVPFPEARREHHDVLINATPIGADGRAMPIPARSLRAAVIGDLVYRPGGTPLIRAARSAGIRSFSGEEALIAQAVRQFELFTGRAAPLPAMRSALRRAIGE
jgi:3-dehydroquinate dehydratase/shikimate dehydrogenase